MNEMLTDIGDVVFTIVIGYIGALEFLYVVRHLYHWTFRHVEQQHDNASNDADSLQSLQNDMRSQLSEAQAKEHNAGTNAMQDGVLYKDGFRIDPQQAEIEKLKSQKSMQDVKMQRQQELEAELKRQRKIEEETRKQLEAAEAALAQQRKQEEAEKHKQMEEETKLLKAREEEQHKLQEEKEALQNAQKLLELERQHEEEQRQKETEEKEAQRKHEEDRRRQQEVDKEKEEQKLREQEQYRIEQEAVKEREREREAVENERRIIEAENRRIEDEMQKEIEREAIEQQQQQRFAAEEKEAQIENEAEEDGEQGIFEADEEEEHANYEAAENIRKLIEAEILQEEHQRQLEEEDDDDEWSEQINNVSVERDRQRQNKQKLIEENARKFLEAEQEMVELQQKMLEATHKSEMGANIESEIPVVEEPCIKKTVRRDLHAMEGAEIGEANEPPTQTVKTQFGQTSNEPYSVSTKPLLFPGVSDDGSSIEPNSMQSSFNTQPSEEIITGTEENSKTISLQFSQQTERQDPDGEDNVPAMQYTDDYLRSLDGIKQRPLVREDGSGRRRAFKKRRSSGSSNSSHESRTSREEEVRMFTSLEEEEFQSAEKGDCDFTPIKYSEQKLKVKGHHRRHKRSPAKDTRTGDESLRSSLEMLGEESTNPWGEVVPEHYKDTAFWKREKAMSIDEEVIDLDKLGLSEKTKDDVADFNKPKTSSFEEATDTQNEEAISALQKQQSQETREKDVARAADTNEATNENNKNLETSHNTEHTPSPNRSSPRLRRSPRIDEMDQYEERWKGTTQQTPDTPTIYVEHAVVSDPWRDEYGLIMEGLSDFYDFQASVNPSRSRSTSRNPSPANSQPNTPTTLKNISFNSEAEPSKADDAYKDTGNLIDKEIQSDNHIDFSIVSRKDENGARVELSNSSDEMHAKVNVDQDEAKAEMSKLIDTLRLERRSRSRSRSPLPTTDNIAHSLETRRTKRIKQNDEILKKLTASNESLPGCEKSPDEEKTNMNTFLQTLRTERSRSRSRSPLPSTSNIEKSLESRRSKRIKHNDEISEKYANSVMSSDESKKPTILETPIISIEYVEPTEDEECSFENMSSLIETLRCQRSRSRSRTPMRQTAVYSISADESYADEAINREGGSRSRTPSRSLSQSPVRNIGTERLSPAIVIEEYEIIEQYASEPNIENIFTEHSTSEPNELSEFHRLLNLEASENKTLTKNSEELETILAAKQRLVDEEALNKLKTANEETELRIMTPVEMERYAELSMEENEAEERDTVSHMPDKERLRQLRCTPTTPDYNRTISAEWHDVQHLKNEMIASGFKRSTYVGESMDLGSEFEPLRVETARFRRSKSPSPSLNESDGEATYMNSEKMRKVQDQILAELTADSDAQKLEYKLGAIPKTPERTSSSTENLDTQQIKAELVDLSAEYGQMREDMAEFRRSCSKSRSPLDETEMKEIAKIEVEAAKRELQDEILDQIQQTTISFQDFSRHLNADFLDSERRASDSALLQKPEILVQFQDSDPDFDMEPEEYHHYRRFSLYQDTPTEEYPDDDFICVSQVEVRTASGTRIREEYYSDELHSETEEIYDASAAQELVVEELHEDQFIARDGDYSDGSEDERRTVVEVDDEIEEDITDFNERGPTDESHHEQSECEEADREFDQYANRVANDWREVQNIMEIIENNVEHNEIEEGAVGGLGNTYDSDSFTIDQIYDEAIRNRKQSGILRDYDSILNEMQTNYLQKCANGVENGVSDDDRYAIWAKARELQKQASNSGCNNGQDASIGFLEHEKRDNEMRYLGDANVSARQATRLRSRYGYVPVLQGNAVEDVEVDLNYKPKREYNWRKNFKLDEDNNNNEHSNGENANETSELADNEDDNNQHNNELGQYFDIRKYSLGGESITLFSRSPERNCLDEVTEEVGADQEEVQARLKEESLQRDERAEQKTVKPKTKKKSKKKLRRGSKASIENASKDDEDSENQMYSRRSSSLQMETESPKRKSRSRRSSKSSVTNEDPNALYSPRSSVGNAEPIYDISEEYAEPPAPEIKMKIKKRKRVKETTFSAESQAPLTLTSANSAIDEARKVKTTETTNAMADTSSQEKFSKENTKASVQSNLSSPAAAAAVIKVADSKLTTTSAAANVANTNSTSLTTTAASNATKTTTTATTTPTTPVDTFDILKDANFYPLF